MVLENSACHKERQNKIISWVKKLVEKVNLMKRKSASPFLDQSQEQHACCLKHKAYTNSKQDLWETIETVCTLTNQLYQDLEDSRAQVAALKHKLDAYSKRLDLMASTTLLREGNHSSLMEQVQSNNAARKDFGANVLARLSRLEQCHKSCNKGLLVSTHSYSVILILNTIPIDGIVAAYEGQNNNKVYRQN
ncbi:hypothetical protein DSO57_1002321 [Entomophthora muscae]|uniref:Uncharacterized protein n=1 Tax=Entomophthora muscae TaxID=34485 RepID=A0ACC2UI76_9FUNG|nr:hypothetical protein DSO57_1002321 [Entomophthora muscae]